MVSKSAARPSNEAFPASLRSTRHERSSTPWRTRMPSIQSNHFRSTVEAELATDANSPRERGRTNEEKGRRIAAGYRRGGKNRGIARVREPGAFGRADHGRRRASYGERPAGGSLPFAAGAVLQHRD